VDAIRLSAPRTFDRVSIVRRTLGPSEVRVRVEAVSICGSDLQGYLGTHPRIKPPTILGHELSGIVIEAGSKVVAATVGSRVAVDPTSGCGSCRHCLAGRWNVCDDYIVLGEGEALPGGLAGEVIVQADRVFTLAEHLDWDIGAIAQPLSVAMHAIRDRARVEPGEVVLVFGGGPIGIGAMLAAHAYGGRTVIVDVIPERLRLARAMGASITIDASAAADVDRAVLEATGGVGADVVIEAIGGPNAEIFGQALRLTARGGRLVVVGLKTPSVAFDLGSVKWGEKSIIGSQAHPDTFPEVLARLADETLPAAPMITHRFDWDHVAEAFALLESRADGVMKVVLTR
jgi:threonine dehydrogenase-like Zn-dependent dehydrogenase